MFELTAGFVVSKFFNVAKASGKIFYPMKSFSDGSIGHLSPDLRFVIPAIKGNDSLECLDIEYQGHKLSDIDEIIQIGRDHSIENFPCDPDTKEELTKRYKEAKHYYKIVEPMKLEDVSKDANVKFPKWALCRYRNGHFHRWMVQNLVERRCTLPIMVEDMDMKIPNCHEASKEIREFIQGTLVGRRDIEEFVRDKEYTICPNPLPHQPWPDLQKLDKLSRDERMEIVCKVLDYDRQTLTTELEPEWQLVVAASSFWLRRSALDKNRHRKIAPEGMEKLARALVSCFINCHRKYMCRFSSSNGTDHQLPLIHCFSQWQSVYYFTVMLNQLLQEPFQYTSPGLIFDGRRALHFAMLYLHEGKSETEVFRCPEDLTLHKRLYRLIMKGDEHQEVHQEEEIQYEPTIPTTN